MKNVIHIFGASGAGTSTLGRKICAELGYKFMDTDDYFWLPTDPAYTEKRPREERIELMNRDIDAAENVVISGSLIGWGDVFIPRFTLAIRVETDADIRAERLHCREKEKLAGELNPAEICISSIWSFLNGQRPTIPADWICAAKPTTINGSNY